LQGKAIGYGRRRFDRCCVRLTEADAARVEVDVQRSHRPGQSQQGIAQLQRAEVVVRRW
jgi:hypothetical protein